jgi:hypothetical protein
MFHVIFRIVSSIHFILLLYIWLANLFLKMNEPWFKIATVHFKLKDLFW